MPPEAFSRVLIDEALKSSGWDMAKNVHFELTGSDMKVLLQEEFAARVGEIRVMQADQSASRKRLDDLFQSMLHRAFEEEL